MINDLTNASQDEHLKKKLLKLDISNYIILFFSNKKNLVDIKGCIFFKNIL